MSKTSKAYISEVHDGPRYVLGACYGHRESCGCMTCEDARYHATTDELSRILAQTEEGCKAGELCRMRDERVIVLSRTERRWQERAGYLAARDVTVADILLDRLAAFVADGGPADELAQDAWDATGYYGVTRKSLEHYWADEEPTDPVILAGQRDLAVLQAYAEGRV